MDENSVALLRAEVSAMRMELAALRQDIAPLLKWKSGVVALVGIVVTLGMLTKAVESIMSLFHK